MLHFFFFLLRYITKAHQCIFFTLSLNYLFNEDIIFFVSQDKLWSQKIFM